MPPSLSSIQCLGAFCRQQGREAAVGRCSSTKHRPRTSSHGPPRAAAAACSPPPHSRGASGASWGRAPSCLRQPEGGRGVRDCGRPPQRRAMPGQAHGSPGGAAITMSPRCRVCQAAGPPQQAAPQRPSRPAPGAAMRRRRPPLPAGKAALAAGRPGLPPARSSRRCQPRLTCCVRNTPGSLCTMLACRKRTVPGVAAGHGPPPGGVLWACCPRPRAPCGPCTGRRSPLQLVRLPQLTTAGICKRPGPALRAGPGPLALPRPGGPRGAPRPHQPPQLAISGSIAHADRHEARWGAGVSETGWSRCRALLPPSGSLSRAQPCSRGCNPPFVACRADPRHAGPGEEVRHLHRLPRCRRRRPALCIQRAPSPPLCFPSACCRLAVPRPAGRPAAAAGAAASHQRQPAQVSSGGGSAPCGAPTDCGGDLQARMTAATVRLR